MKQWSSLQFAHDSIAEAWKYDELGQPTSYTDGRLNEIWQTYNSMGLPEDTIAPAAGAHTAVADRRWRTSYDGAGRAVTQSSPGGVSTSTTYDELGRPTQVTGTGAGAATETQGFDWDQVGQMESAWTPTSNQDFTYYDSGLLRESTGGSGDSSFEYDSDGRLTQQIDSSGTVDVSYDDRGFPEHMTSTLAGAADFTYDPAGRPSTVNYGAGTTRTFTYDAWGQVDTDVLAKSGTATPLYSVDYGYDLDGNITSKAVTGTDVPAAGTNTYAYDWASRITSWTRPGGAAEPYTWDKAGNRTGFGASTAQYDPQNRLTTVSGADGQTTNSWNADGTLDQQDAQAAQRRVSLVVANPASLTAGDTALRDHLVGAGAAVTLVDDASAAPTTNVDVIVVAPSVDATTLAAKYKDVTTPVVTLASGTWQTTGLTNAAPTSASGTTAHVADAIHPVAAGKTGTVTLLTSSDSLARSASSAVGTGARRVWAASSGSTDSVAVAYDTGAARPTSPASVSPARRVAIGYSAGAVGKLNSNGWAIVDPAVPNGYGYTAQNPLGAIDPTGGSLCWNWLPWECEPSSDVETGGGCWACNFLNNALSLFYLNFVEDGNNGSNNNSPSGPPGGDVAIGNGSGDGGGSGGGNGSGSGSGGGPAPNPNPTNCSGTCGGLPPGSADAPPRPTSNLEEQVAAGQPAMPNYPGRTQRDRSTGEIVDTGLSGDHGQTDVDATIDPPRLPVAPSVVEPMTTAEPWKPWWQVPQPLSPRSGGASATRCSTTMRSWALTRLRRWWRTLVVTGATCPTSWTTRSSWRRSVTASSTG